MRLKEVKKLAQGYRVVGDRAENKCIIHQAWITAQDALLTKHMTFNKSLFSLEPQVPFSENEDITRIY